MIRFRFSELTCLECVCRVHQTRSVPKPVLPPLRTPIPPLTMSSDEALTQMTNDEEQTQMIDEEPTQMTNDEEPAPADNEDPGTPIGRDTAPRTTTASEEHHAKKRFQSGAVYDGRSRQPLFLTSMPCTFVESQWKQALEFYNALDPGMSILATLGMRDAMRHVKEDRIAFYVWYSYFPKAAAWVPFADSQYQDVQLIPVKLGDAEHLEKPEQLKSAMEYMATNNAK